MPALDWAVQAGAVDDVLAALDQRSRRRRRRRLTVGAMVAVALLTVAGGTWRGMSKGAADPQHVAAADTIRVVEPRFQTLPDGSVVALRDGAEIAVNFTPEEREILLLAGTAHFDVAKNPQRPFVVRVPGLAVRAVGTAFTVERQLAATTVLVTEGVVEVDAESADATTAGAREIDLARLDAGDGRVFATAAGVADGSGQELSEAAKTQQDAWRIPRLEFAGAPLADVLARFNQHNATQFVIVDTDLAELRLSGVLRVDRIEAMVFMLESDFPVRVEQQGNEIRLHHRL